jgi:hypothetical protein
MLDFYETSKGARAGDSVAGKLGAALPPRAWRFSGDLDLALEQATTASSTPH